MTKQLDSERADIERAVHRSWRLVDQTDGSTVHEGYADGAVFATPAVQLTGRDEIAAGHRARHASGPRLSRHIVSNLDVESDGSRATVGYVLTLFSGKGSAPMRLANPQAVCDVEDRWVKVGDDWRIARRELIPIFISDDNDSVMLGRANP